MLRSKSGMKQMNAHARRAGFCKPMNVGGLLAGFCFPEVIGETLTRSLLETLLI